MNKTNESKGFNDTAANMISIAAVGSAPETIVSQVVFGGIGHIIGRGSGKLIQRMLKNQGGNMISLRKFLSTQERVVSSCITNKFESDCRNLTLLNPQFMNRVTSAATLNAQRNKSFKRGDQRISDIFDATTIPAIAFRGNMPKDYVRILSNYGKISLHSTATTVGPLAIVKSNQSLLEELGIEIQMSHSSPNGLDLVGNLADISEPDFAITIDAPYAFFSDIKSANSYRMVSAISRDHNVLLHRNNIDVHKIKRIWVIPKTSAYEAHISRMDLFPAAEVLEIEFAGVPHLLDKLEQDEGLWAWSALGAYEKERGNISATAPLYYSNRSLIRHARLDKRPDVTHAFLTLLVALANATPNALEDSGFLTETQFRDVFSKGMGRLLH